MKRRSLAALALPAIVLALAACSAGDGDATPTLPPPTATSSPAPATVTPAPAPTATPEIGVGAAIVVGGDVRVRSAPTTQSDEVATLADLTPVTIARAVQGENWLVGTQTWVPSVPPWTSTWYELTDGTYIYAAFVFMLQPGEASPFADPNGAEKWIDVNVTTQTAAAMIGGTAIYTAPVSSGSPQFPSPLGTHAVEPDGRIAVERMTSAQAGYNAQQARYDVERVLFTQYYDRHGDALHLNYWRPASIFGQTATSHGCVGMQLHDAQYFWLFAEAGTRVEIHA
ncbi:MAG TPA: L,D-transpeptidase family protein [Dehalococcoidia bacterium]|jgi:lipoprotein-anchoring transpeptidase ErfK/SrfK|nr:L,D-transpeptidase family protein [Dehalococcoidia bacterium]